MVVKLELNNELITLRTLIGKAKVRTINKLTRKLKEIEHGKTKDPKNAKLDTKASKLVEELKLLKDAKKLDMVKKVFIFSEDPEKELKLQKATAEERAICRLLMNPFLKEAVAASKTKLGITADDEEWKTLLFAEGKNKTKKLRKEKFEVAAGITPATALEKKIAAKIARNKAKKAAKKGGKKEAPKELDEEAMVIDQEVRKERFEEKRRERGYVKPKNKYRGPVDKSSPPKKVSLFPVKGGDAQKAEKPDYVKKARTSDSGEAKKWDNDRPRKSFPAKPEGSAERQPRIEKSTEKLHPSWEAKKLKKPAISDFKGKKTTFDD